MNDKFENKNIGYNRVKCPIKWFCKALNKKIVVSKEAVYRKDGWICDCGRFVKGVDVVHKDVLFGKREMVIFKKVDK